ncbi:hypothetical protein Tco_0712025 [Tanacetum coccineum]
MTHSSSRRLKKVPIKYNDMIHELSNKDMSIMDMLDDDTLHAGENDRVQAGDNDAISEMSNGGDGADQHVNADNALTANDDVIVVCVSEKLVNNTVKETDLEKAKDTRGEGKKQMLLLTKKDMQMPKILTGPMDKGKQVNSDNQKGSGNVIRTPSRLEKVWNKGKSNVEELKRSANKYVVQSEEAMERRMNEKSDEEDVMENTDVVQSIIENEIFKQYVLCQVETIPYKIKFYVSLVYASNNGIERKEVWNCLVMDKRISGNQPWVIIDGLPKKLKSFRFANYTADKHEFIETIEKGDIVQLKLSKEDAEAMIVEVSDKEIKGLCLILIPLKFQGLVGNCKDISACHDKWCQMGPLDIIISKKDLHLADDAKVADLIHNGRWIL